MAMSASKAIGIGHPLAHESAGWTAVDIALIFSVALGVRLVLWPLATTETGDAITRVWIAWDWLSHPTLITHGVWEPLHFYLMAPILWWFQDPVGPPIALHVILGSLVPIGVYCFVREEFSGRRASLIVALIFALYPIAIRNSLMAVSETPFILFLIISLFFLARARTTGGRASDALLAGFSLTLACMLRYEGWMLIPFLAILLWRQPRLMLLFAGVALIHPVFWMIGNQVHFGDPLYGIHAASNFELVLSGKSAMPIGARVQTVVKLAWFTVEGITPLVAVPAALGAGLALVDRSRQAVWLLPCAGLFALFAIGCLRGGFTPKPLYTVTFGLFMIPYLAVILNRLSIEQLSVAGFSLVAVACVASLLAVSVPDPMRTTPVIRWLQGISPVPGFPHQDLAMRLIEGVKPHLLTSDDGYVSDFYGSQPTLYVALRTGLHPDRIFVASGVLNVPPDLPTLNRFLDRYPKGVLLLQADSRFCDALAVKGDQALVEGRVLLLAKVAQVPWPPPEVQDLRGASPCGGKGLNVFRYQRQ